MAKRILIIEDEPHIADAVAYNLKKEGFEVSIVADGEVGLDKIIQEEPELCLLLKKQRSIVY